MLLDTEVRVWSPAVADRRVTRLPPQALAELVVELGPRWQACQDARLADRPRQRAVRAGPVRLPMTAAHAEVLRRSLDGHETMG